MSQTSLATFVLWFQKEARIVHNNENIGIVPVINRIDGYKMFTVLHFIIRNICLINAFVFFK